IPENKRYKAGLSIDGGGIRGLLPAIWLDHIETKHKPISKIFDYIGGTSIGGILALGLASPLEDQKPLSAAKLVDLLEKRGKDIFPSRSKYNIFGRIKDNVTEVTHARYEPTSLVKLLKEYFKDIELGQTLKNVVITAVNAQNHTPFIFK